MKKSLTLAAVFAGVVVMTGRPAAAQNAATQPATMVTLDQQSAEENIRLFRKDVRSVKKQIISANIELTDTEAQQFWPVYDRYTAEMDKIEDDQLDTLLISLKPYLLCGHAHFIVVAGQQLYYKYRLTHSQNDAILSSLFARVIHISLLRQHDLKFEEDNWEAPTLGAWGVGWQVMLDGLEITQFTYFQQCGGQDLDPISAEITYGLERIAAFLQDVDSLYDVIWTGNITYGEVRHLEEVQFSVYNFEEADVSKLWEHLRLYEAECQELLNRANQQPEELSVAERRRFPILPAYDLCLKCSHLFNLLDARGAVSVTERVGVIARIRNLAVGIAKVYSRMIARESHG